MAEIAARFTLITAARLLDGTGSAPAEQAALLVENGSVVKLGRAADDLQLVQAVQDRRAVELLGRPLRRRGGGQREARRESEREGGAEHAGYNTWPGHPLRVECTRMPRSPRPTELGSSPASQARELWTGGLESGRPYVRMQDLTPSFRPCRARLRVSVPRRRRARSPPRRL